MKDIRIHESWKTGLSQEFQKPYWESLTAFVRGEYTSKIVYPPAKNIFRAFDLCPFNEVKVVIVGQDPYHGLKQANGLSFAVNAGLPLPPSLQNIFQEIKADVGVQPIPSGDLSRWARQGVLLLNSVLTVQANLPASHTGKGWELFTDAAIEALNKNRSHIVYLLWGRYAQSKGMMINRQDNLVLTSGHPSPYSANLFFGQHHFSKANAYLLQYNESAIDWR